MSIALELAPKPGIYCVLHFSPTHVSHACFIFILRRRKIHTLGFGEIVESEKHNKDDFTTLTFRPDPPLPTYMNVRTKIRAGKYEF